MVSRDKKKMTTQTKVFLVLLVVSLVVFVSNPHYYAWLAAVMMLAVLGVWFFVRAARSRVYGKGKKWGAALIGLPFPLVIFADALILLECLVREEGMCFVGTGFLMAFAIAFVCIPAGLIGLVLYLRSK